MNEWVEQWIWTKFWVKLKHFSTETIQMMQKAAAMGTWGLAASRRQRACSCIMSHAEFFGETSNHPGDSDPYIPDLVSCDFWLFPKQKSPLKGKRFQTFDEIQENTMGRWWPLRELCEVPRCLLWKVLRCHCPMYNVSCILYLLQWSEEDILLQYMAGYFLDRLYICIHTHIHTYI